MIDGLIDLKDVVTLLVLIAQWRIFSLRWRMAAKAKRKQRRGLSTKRSAEVPEDDLPALPEADENGNRSALEFIRVSIARDIIRERKALGLTQEQLAKLAGIRQETLSGVESAKHSPTVRTVSKIEQALKRATVRQEKSRKRR